MKIVSVQFNEVGQEYSYIFDLPDSVSVGDFVVVDSPYRGFSTAKVTGVHTSLTGGKATNYVVSYVDATAYYKRKADKARAEEIKEVLAKKLKAFEEVALYKMMSEQDDEAALLIKELKSIKL